MAFKKSPRCNGTWELEIILHVEIDRDIAKDLTYTALE